MYYLKQRPIQVNLWVHTFCLARSIQAQFVGSHILFSYYNCQAWVVMLLHIISK